MEAVMSHLDWDNKEILKLFNLDLDDPIFQLLKERAHHHKLYIREFLIWLTTVNTMEGKDCYATPTKETIKKTEKELENYKRISDRYDDGYDINNEPFK